MNTDMTIDLKGKINNMPDFYNTAFLPVFEAVVNSIQSIEDSQNKERGEIIVRIKRKESEQQQEITEDGSIKYSEKEILGFEIEDNGMGFTSENFASFNKSDSTYKLSKGCKGIGRFSWLKAFDKVNVSSIYQQGENKRLKSFSFSLDGVKDEKDVGIAQNIPLKTTISLDGFKTKYRESPSAFKTTAKIAQRILEHCLLYFILETPITIKIEDQGEITDLLELYNNEYKTTLKCKGFELMGEKFKTYHLKLPSTRQTNNNLVYCANNREVVSVNIGKKIGSNSAFREENDGGKFVYTVYVCGEYLDKGVDPSRLEFLIPASGQSTVFHPITISDIEKEIIKQIKDELSPYIRKIEEKKNLLITNYVSTIAPQFRCIAKYGRSQLLDEITADSSEEEILEAFCKVKANLETDIRERTKDLLKTQPNSFSSMSDKIKECSDQLSDMQKDMIADYVLRRKYIIELFDKKLQSANDKYQKEEILHDIIFPRNKTSDDILYENHNLWLIDDRLSFHEILRSDICLNKDSTSESNDRPDLFIMHEVDPDTAISRYISIIELKRPGRDGISSSEINDQLLDYVRQIRNNSFKSASGRLIRAEASTRFYVYYICDISESIKSQITDFLDFVQLPGELGYYKYYNNLGVHANFIDYNKIVGDAKKRNFAFFKELGIENLKFL